MSFEERFQSVCGARTRFVVGGSGKPLLLIHGLGTSSISWRDNLAIFARTHRVYALDLPGHGGSEALPGEYSLALAAQFLKDFLDSQGIARAFLAGSSMGGLLALNFARLFPERVEKLVLVDSAGLGRELVFFLRFLSIPVVGEIFESRSRGQIRGLLRSIFYNPKLVTEELVEQIYSSRRGTGKKEAMLRALRAGVDFGGQRREIIQLHRLSLLALPTLIVWGANDRLIPISHALRAHKLIKDSKLIVFEQCGHWPQMEKAEAFNRVVPAFLNEA